MNQLISPKTVDVSLPMFSQTMGGGGRLTTVTPEGAAFTAAWGESQVATLTSLQRAVNEGSVFGAVTGPPKSGKSAILAELLASSKSKDRVCVDVRTPHQVSEKTAKALGEAIGKVARQLSIGAVQTLIVVDNAHTATRELLLLLNRFAASRSSFGSPQVILGGEPELWECLGSRCYDKLLRRIAIRCSVESSATGVSLGSGNLAGRDFRRASKTGTPGQELPCAAEFSAASYLPTPQ